jgi:hypothetical protein
MKGWRVAILFIYLLSYRGLVFSIEDIPLCYKELEVNFFKYETVVQAFSMHRIGQSQWSYLANALKEKSKVVPDLVNAQAQQLNPNPLERPFQVQAAVDILQKALFLVFRQVLLESNVTEVTNEVAVREMFQHIWMSQHRTIVNCLGDAAVAKERVTE